MQTWMGSNTLLLPVPVYLAGSFPSLCLAASFLWLASQDCQLATVPSQLLHTSAGG